MTETLTLVVSRRIAAEPQAVFDAWLDPQSVRHWLFATPDGVMETVELDPRVGGRFRIVERRGADRAEHFGEYREIERPSRLAFDFWTSFSDQPTLVTVAIEPAGDGSLLTLTHHGVWEEYEKQTHQGWTMILESLERSLA